MKVRDIMTKDPQTATVGTYTGDVARMMRDLDVGIIPVVDERGSLLGVITDRDITVRVTAAGLNPFETSVQDFLSPNPVTVSPDVDLDEARQLMGDRQIRRLPVVDNGKLVGILSIGDVATKDTDQEKATGNALEEISKPTNLSKTS